MNHDLTIKHILKRTRRVKEGTASLAATWVVGSIRENRCVHVDSFRLLDVSLKNGLPPSFQGWRSQCCSWKYTWRVAV